MGKLEQRLNKDCLENVFGRVGVESLLLDVPFVCKSWLAATLEPSCWQSINIPDIRTNPRAIYSDDILRRETWKFDPFLKRFVKEYRIDKTNFSVTAFIKFVIDRSKGCATCARLPLCSKTALEYVADMCPRLKEFSSTHILNDQIELGLIQKWKHLESLAVSRLLFETISQICIHCKNFCCLHTEYYVGEAEAIAIGYLLPNIKYLTLRSAYIYRNDLIMLLQGCKELEALVPGIV